MTPFSCLIDGGGGGGELRVRTLQDRPEGSVLQNPTFLRHGQLAPCCPWYSSHALFAGSEHVFVLFSWFNFGMGACGCDKDGIFDIGRVLSVCVWFMLVLSA